MDNIENNADYGKDAVSERGSEPNNETDAFSKTALEFEYTDEIGGLTFTEEIPIVSPAETSSEIGTEENDATKSQKKTKPTVIEDEFILPAGFRSNGKDAFGSEADKVYSLKTAYVPTFTGASEKYRIRGESRLADAQTQSERSANAAESAAVSKPAPELDPTAEIGGSSEVKRIMVSVGSDRIKEPIDENITIYKFDSPEDSDKCKHTVPTAEELMTQLSAETNNEPSYEQEPSVEPEVTLSGEYHMPDPTTSDSSDGVYVPEYMQSEDAPFGALSADENNMLSSPEKRDAVKDSFLDSLIAARIRLFTVTLLLIGAFMFEFFSSDIINFLGFGNSLEATLLIDFQICLCMLLLALPELIHALRYLVKGIFVPELMILLSAAAIVAYTVISGVLGASVLMHFSILFGIQIQIGIFAALCKLKADFSVFKLATKGEVKSVVDIRRTRELPRENLALDGAVDEFKSYTARVFNTECVADFKKTTEKNEENSVNVIIMLCVSFGVAFVASVVSYFISGWSLINAANTFALVVLLSNPAASLLLHKLPFLHASREANTDNCGFIGESAIVKCAGVNVLCYDDTEVFGAEDVSIRQVYLYGKAYNMTKAMNEMYALFSVVGGSLGQVFASALDRKGEPAEGIIIEPDGISGVVNGSPVAAGTEEYMLRHGIKVPNPVGKVKNGAPDSTRVMYGASDGEVYVKFLIRYSFSEEFSMLIPHLKASKIVPLIYTCDPNINLELVRVLTFGEDIIRVMKKNIPDTFNKKFYPHISSGVVSLGDKTSVFGTLVLGKKYRAFQSETSVFEPAAVLLGAIGGVLISLSGAFFVPVAALAVWQLSLNAAVFVKSKLTFNRKKRKPENV